MNRPPTVIAALAIGSIASLPAQAIPLRDGLSCTVCAGGDLGFGELTQNRNDDGSSNSLAIPFTLNFFGNNFNSFFVNNNGNVTFNSPSGTFTPDPFPIPGQPRIAPFWGDVDTRNGASGLVYIGSPNPDAVVVTWHNVGYFASQADKLNDFQLTLLNRNDTGAGNFDIEFRYNQLQWTTGSASGGVNGLGGTPAQAGYNAGDDINFFTLPGSRTAAVLDLQNTSNVSLDTPGLWVLNIRNGEIGDGSSPDAPLLPEIVQEDGWHFDFNIVLNQRIFIDPLLAVGYDYVVTSGPNFASVVLPTVAGDTDGYDIFGFNPISGLYDILLGHVADGVEFFFAQGGVSQFGVRDIDIDAALDPNDTEAFVTGLTFAGSGQVSMIQSPVTLFVPDQQADLPEPGGLLLLGAGIASLVLVRRRRGKN